MDEDLGINIKFIQDSNGIIDGKLEQVYEQLNIFQEQNNISENKFVQIYEQLNTLNETQILNIIQDNIADYL